jgi:hypothetical protein
MSLLRGITLVGLLALILAAGFLLFVLPTLPVRLQGKPYESLVACAEHQKSVYQSIVHYQKENGRLPEKGQGFPADGKRPLKIWRCPISETPYLIEPASYGSSDHALIADSPHRHHTTFMWWLRGMKPQVETMGDGTVHLFEGGVVLMRAQRKEP